MVIFGVDGSLKIKKRHLRAALALWKYCADSARYIFGGSTGDDIADRVVKQLRLSPEGMTRTEIGRLFGNHVTSQRIDVSLGQLLKSKRIACETNRTGGRPGKRYSIPRGVDAA